MSLAAEDFAFVSDIARRDAAIVLEKGKEYLVETRLGPVAKKEGFNSLAELIGAMRKNVSGPALTGKVIDALTTNETFFFRDFHPFEALRQTVIPQLIEQRSSQRKLTIWSAACSSGQEAFSLAMLLREHFPVLATWKIEIVGTDLSPTILARAKTGSYSQLEVNRGLPAHYLVKYFSKENETWNLKTEIRRMVEFRPMNLVQSWPIMAPFDLVFIRNVMIYFDVETKKKILQKLRSCVLPHGYLILGAAETTVNLDPSWKPVRVDKAVLYQLS